MPEIERGQAKIVVFPNSITRLGVPRGVLLAALGHGKGYLAAVWYVRRLGSCLRPPGCLGLAPRKCLLVPDLPSRPSRQCRPVKMAKLPTPAHKKKNQQRAPSHFLRFQSDMFKRVDVSRGGSSS